MTEGDIISGVLTTIKDDSLVGQADKDGRLEFEYEIFKIGATSKAEDRQDIQYVTLHFCSPLWTDNMKARVSQAFCQTPYTSAAKQIYDEYLTKGGLQEKCKTKELEIEQSDEMFNFIIPNWKPLEAIMWLASRSWKDKQVSYRFFEDKEKYRLVTLSKLMKEGPKLTYYITSQNMEYTQQGNGSNIQVDFDQSLTQQRYNFLYNISFRNTQDINSASNSWLFGQRLITHDITTKRVKDYYHTGPEAGNYKLGDPRDFQQEFNDMGGPMNGGEPLIDNKVSKKMSPKEGNEKLVVYPVQEHEWTGVKDNFKPDKWLRQYRGQTGQLEFYSVEASCPGNFTMKAGDVIEVKWYSPHKGNGKEQKEDERHTGRWLVSYVTRNFGDNNDTFTMRIRLTRNDRKLSPNPVWMKPD